MAKGVRIHHPTLTDCTVLIPHPGDPTTGRLAKDYHIRLDADGDTIVSETVLRRLMEARNSGLSPHDFLVLNDVWNPPDQIVSADKPGRQMRVFKQMRDGLYEATHDVFSVAQQFAPRGLKPRITTRKDA